MALPVLTRRVAFHDQHMDQKYLVLEAYVEGLPQLTKRATINTAALADGSVTLEAVRAKLVSDVLEYHDRWRAVEEAVKNL